MKIKSFNVWYKRILSLLLSFTFIFGSISPIFTYGAATDTSTASQWNGNYRINTYKGLSGSIDIYGTCLLTEDGHFFRSNSISETYSDTLYNSRGYQIFDQTLENGRWYEPFIGNTFKNAYFGNGSVLLVGHDGKLYQAYYRDSTADCDSYLNELSITESDIDDVNLIEDLIKTKDNNYYTFSIVTYDNGETSELDYDKLDAKPDDTTVKQVGENQYPITYKGVMGTLVVPGYDIDKIIAEYKGPDIIVGKDYSKDNVIVTVHYTNGKTSQVTDFSVDSLTVTKVGENNYVATYKEKTAQYIVTGITEPANVIETDNEDKNTVTNYITQIITGDSTPKTAKDPSMVKTGDSFPIVLCLTLMIMSAAGMILIFVYRHKRRKK